MLLCEQEYITTHGWLYVDPTSSSLCVVFCQTPDHSCILSSELGSYVLCEKVSLQSILWYHVCFSIYTPYAPLKMGWEAH